MCWGWKSRVDSTIWPESGGGLASAGTRGFITKRETGGGGQQETFNYSLGFRSTVMI